jgi:spore germination protein KA
LSDFKKNVSRWLFFNEPPKTEKFILKETEGGSPENEIEKEESEKREQTERRRKRKDSELLLKKEDKEKDDEESENEDGDSASEISTKLSNNLEYMKKVYNIPINGDIIIREFEITVKNGSIGAFIIFFDGMTDRMVINLAILQPLMLLSNLDIRGDEDNVASYVKKHLIPQNQLKVGKNYHEIIDGINFGACGLFIDGIDTAFIADVKGWEHRGVERPNTEVVIRGPQEGFNEVLRANTALVRKILKDEDLMAEDVAVGRRSKTPCSLLYIKDIANDSLVNEVRKRLNKIELDYIIDSGELEQMLEDSTFLPGPQIIATERPDRVASMLSEGKVAVIMNGSPFALVMPATILELLHSPEDAYARFPYANLFRIVRIIGILLSLLLPGSYVAITNYHQEMIPVDLLFAISASREKVPFPSVVEILIMEMAFELIREAGIRIPGPIGPTLGIIGALILGQAAVSANIVSPILIIIVAVTGIGSFAVSNFSLAISIRVLRFAYILLGASAGFLGITLGLFLQGLWFTSAKSFGLPYTASFGPKTKNIFIDALTRAPLWMQEERPDYLNTKDKRKQPEISREWASNKPEDDENGE